MYLLVGLEAGFPWLFCFYLFLILLLLLFRGENMARKLLYDVVMHQIPPNRAIRLSLSPFPLLLRL